jgi:hypothetical protein
MSDPLSRLQVRLRRRAAILVAALTAPVVVLACAGFAVTQIGVELTAFNQQRCGGSHRPECEGVDLESAVRARDVAGVIFAAAVVSLVGAGIRARGVLLEITVRHIRAGGRDEPTAWLKSFVLGPRRTVLHGHDGKPWVLPAVPAGQRDEVEQTLLAVVHATAEPLNEERASATRAAEVLGPLRGL